MSDIEDAQGHELLSTVPDSNHEIRPPNRQSPAKNTHTFPALRLISLLFLISGASSLIFETIFTRLLTYTFGNTSQAVSTVLAAFLAGLALGAFLFGRWVDRRPPSLWIYGCLELLVGLYCLFIPKFFILLTDSYVALHHRFQLGPLALTMVRFGLATLVILVPTILMGGSLPALARYVSARCEPFEPELDRLYAFNTLGAAAGGLLSTFLLMPFWGITWTIGVACGANFIIFACVALLIRTSDDAPRGSERSSEAQAREITTTPSGATAILLLGACLTGAAALAYEVLWTHVLTFTVGNTVYAFGSMLFAVLCGLGWGAQIVSNHLKRPATWATVLGISQFALGLVVFIATPFWDRVPAFFTLGLGQTAPIALGFLVALRITLTTWRNRREGQSRRRGWLRANEPLIDAVLFCAAVAASRFFYRYDISYFVAEQLVRFSCAFFLLIVPALLLGLSFPLLLNLYARETGRAGESVGRVYAANTAGSILGSLLAGFVLLPRLGSLASLRCAACVNLLLGMCFLVFLLPLGTVKKVALAFASVPVAVLLWVLPGNWDARRMSSGAYVYFSEGYPADRVLYFKEDVQGGLTSVVEIASERFLLSNGKFQGNSTHEVQAQIRFALIPMLFVHKFGRALVVGLGTGNTLRSVSRFPFQQIDVAELAAPIVESARLWFEDVNGRVLDQDGRVRLSIADGRNFLLLSRETYDLINMEITSIWIGGEADLYNKEFYELSRAHLGPHGILQQWVQIHHLRTKDLLVLLNTAAQVFPHVAFFQGPEQGVLVASASPLELDYRQMELYDSDPRIREELEAIGLPSISSLVGELMLYDDSLRRAVAQLPALGGLAADLISTDFYPYLEYQTPKGNFLPYDTAPLNLKFMQRFRPTLPPSDMPIRNLVSDDEKNLLLGYIAEQRGDVDTALEFFKHVGGLAGGRAQHEIEKIAKGTRKETH